MTGAIAMASAIVALFFLRFWRDTGDRLFWIFALSFFLLGVTRLGLAFSRGFAEPLALSLTEAESPWYWVRLAAFVLILLAIVDKNRRK